MKNFQAILGTVAVVIATLVLSVDFVPRSHAAEWLWHRECVNSGRTCPPCVPFGSCQVTMGQGCVGFGGAEGCLSNAGWAVGDCNISLTQICLYDTNFCGPPKKPHCQPIKDSVGNVIACQPGGCVDGGTAVCSGC